MNNDTARAQTTPELGNYLPARLSQLSTITVQN